MSLLRTPAVCTALLLAFASASGAQVPPDYMKSLETAARAADSRFAGFSAERGQAWFNARHGTDWSCSTCHTENPLAVGRHATTGVRLLRWRRPQTRSG